MQTLVIAGTSVGGSSYTDRIINALNNNVGHNLTVLVAAGDFQQQVKGKVQRNIEQLNTLLRQRGSYPININIELETSSWVMNF